MRGPTRRKILTNGAAAVASLTGVTAYAQASTRMLPPEFKGHGCFLYDPEETVARYGSPEAVAEAVSRAHMQHAWVRLHDVEAVVPFDLTQKIIQALRAKSVHVAGYGWCHGRNPSEEANLGVRQIKAHGLTHYVANIEQGKLKGRYGNSKWTVDGIEQYCRTFRSLTPSVTSLLISTYPFIGDHAPELMKAASPHVDGFAPQIYWYRYPAAWMWPRKDLPIGVTYRANEPAEYASLCLDMWRSYTNRPLLITGQAYWSTSERADFDTKDAEAKMLRFLNTFDSYPRIVGLNWWHLGSRSLTVRGGAMTRTMHEILVRDDQSKKPYARA